MNGKKTFLEKVENTIEKYQMLPLNARVVVGVSGGPDSVALLHLLFRLKSKYNLKLWASCLNHQLRGEEADKEVERVKGFASQLGIPVILESFNVALLAKEEKLSLEEAARRVRYDFFERAAKRVKADKIALGHTASDQIETFLMRMIRGSGLDGLSGIPPVRGKIIRPLIEIFREETENYCQKNSLYICIDSSNKKTYFLRNKIRLHLIPYLCKKYNPRLIKSLFHTSEILREENFYLKEKSEEEFKSLLKKKDEKCIVLNGEKLSQLHLALQRRVLRKAIQQMKGDLKGVAFEHIASILKLDERKGCKQLDIPGGVVAQREYKNLLIKKAIRKEDIFSPRSLIVPGDTYLPELSIVLKSKIMYNKPSSFGKDSNEAYFDLDKMKKPLFLRKRKEGDRFYPFGMQGSKKIKDFFINLKIPREKRDKVPLLISKDEIVWIVGYRIDEHFKIRKETKRILKIKVTKFISREN